ncbi:MAG: hypothetical protein AAFW74_08975 [Pseudomonadota bacterium]
MAVLSELATSYRVQGERKKNMEIAANFRNACAKKGHAVRRLAKPLFPILFKKKSSPQGKPWPLVQGRPWMNDLAVSQLERLVRPGSRVFEWGCGGSTIFFAERGAEVICIEHNAEWAALVETELKARGLDKKVTVRHVDLEGEYIDIIDRFKDDFDIVCVDGRKRIESLIKGSSRVQPGRYLPAREYFQRSVSSRTGQPPG